MAETAGAADSEGWRPLRAPARRVLSFTGLTGDSPFARLALTHVLALAGDTLVTIALAGSLFFSISPTAAKSRVALYLVLTMAPFAVVAPLLGPILDRSKRGRRTVVIISSAGRAVVCLLMARNLNSLLLFPEAFVVLVLSKSYLVTKAALVPATVADESQLVRANARLVVLGAIAGFVTAAPGALVLQLFGADWVLRLGTVVFACGVLAGVRLARAPVNQAPAPTPAEAEALHSRDIRLAASAIAVLRGAVGFLTFLLAFSFRRAHAPTWWFGVAIIASVAGTLLGAVAAPRLRRAVSEERILTASLAALAIGAGVCAWYATRAAGAALAGLLGASAAAGKLAFDSIVQRDAPDGSQGRAFARFETRFQLAWVIGALPPVLLAIPRRAGIIAIAVAVGATAVFYAVSRRRYSASPVSSPSSSNSSRAK